jgi:hypothetical protein
MKHHIILPLFLFLQVFTACGNNENNNPTAVAELLTSANWTKFDNPVSVDGSNNFVSNISDCYKDDIWIFETNGKGRVEEGPVLCDPDDPFTLTFVWRLEENDTVLTIAISAGGATADETRYSIVSVTNDRLELLNLSTDLLPAKSKIILMR